jgi:hypothetical protein
MNSNSEDQQQLSLTLKSLFRRLRQRRVRVWVSVLKAVATDCHVIDGVSGAHVMTSPVQLTALPEFSELLSLEELSMDGFVAELQQGVISEVVLLRSERVIADLNTSSVIDESVLAEFHQKFDARRGSTILQNPKDRYYPIVKRFADMRLNKNSGDGRRGGTTAQQRHVQYLT